MQRKKNIFIYLQGDENLSIKRNEGIKTYEADISQKTKDVI